MSDSDRCVVYYFSLRAGLHCSTQGFHNTSKCIQFCRSSKTFLGYPSQRSALIREIGWRPPKEEPTSALESTRIENLPPNVASFHSLPYHAFQLTRLPRWLAM